MSTSYADQAFVSAGGSVGGMAEGRTARPRRSYAFVQAAYATAVRDELSDRPMERSVLSYFTSLVPDGHRVLQVGCGAGRIAGHLSALGLDVAGTDPSPSLVALARQDHPGVTFDVGSATRPDVPPGSLGGLLLWHTLGNVGDVDLPVVLDDVRRSLVPGGVVLVAFAVASPVDGTPPRRPEHVADLLGVAGLGVNACLVREAEGEETAPIAFLLARRPVQAGQTA